MRRIRCFLVLPILLATALPAPAEPPILPPAPLATPARSRFRDWAIACAPDCRAFTRLRAAAPGAPEVLRLTLSPRAEDADWTEDAGGWDAVLRTPLPLYLPDPLILTIGDLPPITIPWFTCARAGCEARLAAGPDIVAALRAGRTADVELTLVGGDHARMRLSLLGFGAAAKAAGEITP